MEYLSRNPITPAQKMKHTKKIMYLTAKHRTTDSFQNSIVLATFLTNHNPRTEKQPRRKQTNMSHRTTRVNETQLLALIAPQIVTLNLNQTSF